jgi:hypothetical protein
MGDEDEWVCEWVDGPEEYELEMSDTSSSSDEELACL